jgi:hypothetical protein
VDNRLDWSIDMIGPLAFESVLALVVATGMARLAALCVWAVMRRMDDAARRIIYGGAIVLILGVVLFALPSILLRWLYSLTHPHAFLCLFGVWPGLLLPLIVYGLGVARLMWRDRRDSSAATAH